MPLRMLMYLGMAYEKIVPTRDRCKRELVKIPTPEFYVFYNGKAELPKEETLKLSDSFKMNEENMFLELKVRVKYLKKNGSEVENMLIAEYDYETDIIVQREEASKEAEEKRKIKDAKILMDFCNDDEVISKKMELDLEKVKELRKEWKKDKK